MPKNTSLTQSDKKKFPAFSTGDSLGPAGPRNDKRYVIPSEASVSHGRPVVIPSEASVSHGRPIVIPSEASVSHIW